MTVIQDQSPGKIGGICSILFGIAVGVTAISYLLMPVEQQTWSDPGAYLASYAEGSTAATIENWAEALGAIFAVAMVLAVSAKVLSVSEGWTRWLSTLAIVGFAAMAIEAFRELALTPGRAATYVAADAATRAAIAENQYLVLLDPVGWFTFGGVGTWLLAVNLLALRGNVWPNLLAYVGAVAAIAYLLILAGTFLQIDALSSVAAAAGVVVGPAWAIWVGLLLVRGRL
jgi:hypothetical protein